MYGLDPRCTPKPTLRQLLRFQAIQDYRSQNRGYAATLTKDTPWKIGPTQQENILETVVDLLRLIVMSKGLEQNQFPELLNFVPVQRDYPELLTQEEIKERQFKRKREIALAMFGRMKNVK